jgi:diguanylate cyclase (GGDEF)-like protein
MKLRLQARYALIILGLIVAIVLSLTALLFQFRQSTTIVTHTSAQVMERDLVEQLKQRGAVMTRLLAENLANPLYKYDMRAINELARAILGQKDIAYVYVYDQQGKIIHNGHARITLFGRILKDEVSTKAVITNDLLIQIAADVMDIAMPIRIGEMVLGGVRVGLSLKGIDKDIAGMRNQLEAISQDGMQRNLFTVITTTLVLVILGIIIAWLVSRRLIHPIQQLARHAVQIGQGNYQPDISIDRVDEIGDLAVAFKEMAANLHRTTAEIRHSAYHDSLTGIPNRLMFKEYLEDALVQAKRHSESLAVLFLDMDNFKRINDTLGHHRGDALLQTFSERIIWCTRHKAYLESTGDYRQDPIIARLGGDEFMILLPSIRDPQYAATVARCILDGLSVPFSLGQEEVVVGASIGITIFPTDGEDFDTLLRNADIAMYHAKEQGKNNYQYFTSSMNITATKKLLLENELRKAIDRQELRLWYQPLIETRTHEIVGVEALIRWQHPEKGLILPAEFIPLAEETGLIVPIGEWVIRTACEEVKRWHNAGMPGIYVAVNLSGVQFRKGGLPRFIAETLTKTGLDPQYLHVELTETSIMHNEHEAAAMLKMINSLGVQIWIDDFGTGYSSLSYLSRFPVNGVKIDRSFVRDIVKDPNYLAITSAIITMVHSLNLTVLAEGVEKQEQLELLRAKGCDLIQGFLYAPQPLQELAVSLRRQDILLPQGGLFRKRKAVLS